MKQVLSICLIAGLQLHVALEARQVVSLDVVNPYGARPSGISGDGLEIIGEGGIDNGYGPFIWTWTAGELTDLGRGRLNDISADGFTIVGEIRHPAPSGYPNSTYGEAAVWRDGAVTPIGHLPGAEHLSSEALLVSGNGSVIIGKSASDAGYEMFRYKDGTLTGLGINGWPQAISHDGGSFIFADDSGLWLWNNWSTEQFDFPGGYTYGAFDMSSDGSLVVGSAWTGPIRWKNGQPIALAIPEDIPDGAGCAAHFVSGDGKVIIGSLFHPIGILYGYLIWRESDNWNPVSLQDLFEGSGLNLPTDLNLGAHGGISYDGTTIIGSQYDGITQQAVRIQIRDMFGQYRITDGIAETGAWLGRVNAAHDPWVWCENAPGWQYFPEETAIAEYGWLYPPDPDTLQIIQVDGTGWGYSFALEKWMYLAASGWVYMM